MKNITEDPKTWPKRGDLYTSGKYYVRVEDYSYEQGACLVSRWSYIDKEWKDAEPVGESWLQNFHYVCSNENLMFKIEEEEA